MTCSLLSVLRGKKITFSQTQGFFILIRHSHYAASMKVVTEQEAANGERNYTDLQN